MPVRALISASTHLRSVKAPILLSRNVNSSATSHKTNAIDLNLIVKKVIAEPQSLRFRQDFFSKITQAFTQEAAVNRSNKLESISETSATKLKAIHQKEYSFQGFGKLTAEITQTTAQASLCFEKPHQMKAATQVHLTFQDNTQASITCQPKSHLAVDFMMEATKVAGHRTHTRWMDSLKARFENKPPQTNIQLIECKKELKNNLR